MESQTELEGMHGFSDEEREQITEQLIETGRELLVTYGPQKTTVQDITDQVGIAQPTFYRFFDAKADLYLVIFQREMKEYVENVRSELAGIEDPQEGLERFFWCYVGFSEENPFIQQVFIQGQDSISHHNVSSDKLEEVQRESMAEILPMIEDLKAECNGLLADIDPFILLGLMGGSIGLLTFHKDEFEKYEEDYEGYEENYYDRIQKVLIRSLARGLTVGE